MCTSLRWTIVRKKQLEGGEGLQNSVTCDFLRRPHFTSPSRHHPAAGLSLHVSPSPTKCEGKGPAVEPRSRITGWLATSPELDIPLVRLGKRSPPAERLATERRELRLPRGYRSWATRLQMKLYGFQTPASDKGKCPPALILECQLFGASGCSPDLAVVSRAVRFALYCAVHPLLPAHHSYCSLLLSIPFTIHPSPTIERRRPGDASCSPLTISFCDFPLVFGS